MLHDSISDNITRVQVCDVKIYKHITYISHLYRLLYSSRLLFCGKQMAWHSWRPITYQTHPGRSFVMYICWHSLVGKFAHRVRPRRVQRTQSIGCKEIRCVQCCACMWSVMWWYAHVVCSCGADKREMRAIANSGDGCAVWWWWCMV